jgi:hypothetical protein
MGGFLPSRFPATIGVGTQTHTHTQTAMSSHKPTFIFFQNEESGLKIDLKEIGREVAWDYLAKDTAQWRALVNTVINLRAQFLFALYLTTLSGFTL